MANISRLLPEEPLVAALPGNKTSGPPRMPVPLGPPFSEPGTPAGYEVIRAPGDLNTGTNKHPRQSQKNTEIRGSRGSENKS